MLACLRDLCTGGGKAAFLVWPGLPAKLVRRPMIEGDFGGCRQLQHVRHFRAGCLVSPGVGAFLYDGSTIAESWGIRALPRWVPHSFFSSSRTEYRISI